MPMPLANKNYVIINVASNTALDLPWEKKQLTGYAIHRQDNQQWHLEEHNNFEYTLKSVKTGHYLAIEGCAQDGIAIITQPHPFKWTLLPDEHDKWTQRLKVPGTNLTMDLDGGKNANGTKVQIWNGWNTKNQTWRFEEAGCH